MKITFLGTGTSQGIPVIGCTHEVCLSDDPKDKRLRSSVLISWGSFKYVIDCGPDFRQQMLTANVENINGILFTHYHADHTAGIDDIRPFSQINGNVPFYAQKQVVENLKERFDYIFTIKNKYLGAPNVDLNEIENESFLLGNIEVNPVEVEHGKLKIFGYRFDKFAYITDANFISLLEKEKLKNLDILVVNALRIDKHPTHYNLQEALDLISEIKPKKAYLTHISHKLGFHAEVSKLLPKNVFLAYDGLSFMI
ncbi:MAG: MBL fold metallo-hydrolase [Flavobacteriaceae bacterium]|nr:MBL fold metallo-hydrolase [Flavobacteriaceae bacterium]